MRITLKPAYQLNLIAALLFIAMLTTISSAKHARSADPSESDTTQDHQI